MSSYKAEVGLENVVSALGSHVCSNGISAMKKERRDVGGHLTGVPIWIKVISWNLTRSQSSVEIIKQVIWNKNLHSLSSIVTYMKFFCCVICKQIIEQAIEEQRSSSQLQTRYPKTVSLRLLKNITAFQILWYLCTFWDEKWESLYLYHMVVVFHKKNEELLHFTFTKRQVSTFADLWVLNGFRSCPLVPQM